MIPLKKQSMEKSNSYNSEILSDFLTYLRDTKQIYNMAVQDENDANDATQDILHSLEIDGGSYHELARLSKVLQDVRRKRREAKDKTICLEPIVQWIEGNAAVIKGLERLLGDVRKAERSLENRTYHQKTNIVETVRGNKIDAL